MKDINGRECIPVFPIFAIKKILLRDDSGNVTASEYREAIQEKPKEKAIIVFTEKDFVNKAILQITDDACAVQIDSYVKIVELLEQNEQYTHVMFNPNVVGVEMLLFKSEDVINGLRNG